MFRDLLSEMSERIMTKLNKLETKLNKLEDDFEKGTNKLASLINTLIASVAELVGSRRIEDPMARGKMEEELVPTI